MICPKCGKETGNGKFCMECGAKLQTVCPKCSVEIPIGSKFCPECGSQIINIDYAIDFLKQSFGINPNDNEAFKHNLQLHSLQAIKILREQTGLDLKEAKSIIDSLKQ